MKEFKYDIIVVGGGHAGSEAAYVSAKSGLKTLLLTTKVNTIAFMSCNPSIGGLAKGHMVREIDALGGLMGKAADASCIQFKRLNAGKGPAVRGTRMQCDKYIYAEFVKNSLLNLEHLEVFEGEVVSLLLEGDKCLGVFLKDGSKVLAKSVIITAGTFLNGVLFMGDRRQSGGRIGEDASVGLSDQLRSFGFKVQRLKTGTPARLLRDSIDFSVMDPQYGDMVHMPFHFSKSASIALKQIPCYLTYTNEKTHEIINNNLHRSPLYQGFIEGVGPRYCPSIEDKVVRYAEKSQHQTFLEPESLSCNSIYLQGISTSLPESVQLEFLRTIKGLEKVEVLKYGYAVEYDFIIPTQIFHTLETRGISNLFLAGQINGTSGYEEAAVQGFIAGVNAVRKIKEQSEFILGRHEAYFSVLVDDLINKGTTEPYRMFTSRAEHRLVLREDNTVDRLHLYAKNLGILNSSEVREQEEFLEEKSEYLSQLKDSKLVPNERTQSLLDELSTPRLLKPTTLYDLLRRSEVSIADLEKFDFHLPAKAAVIEPIEIEIKYEGYIRRQQQLIDQVSGLESFVLPQELDYSRVAGLSGEEIEKLGRVRPRTLGQAQRISGVNPSAVQALVIHLKGGVNAAQRHSMAN